VGAPYRAAIAKRLLREPLLHFLLVGAILFAGDAAMRENDPESDRVIRISESEIARLRAQWTKRYQRPPAPAELQGLVDSRVREELLYREALAMGLDRDDSIVRRRLAQKLEFLIEDLAVTHKPADAELRAFFEARRERYRLPARISFAQAFFSPDRRGLAAERDAGLVLASLRSEAPPAAAADWGDRFLTGEAYPEQSPQDIEAIFGREFAQTLLEMETGVWAGPVASGHGWHLVRIESRSDSRLPTLSEVADQVQRDWAYEKRREMNEAVLEQLATRYELTIEGAALSQPVLAGEEERP
jgi:hypothetical protein